MNTDLRHAHRWTWWSLVEDDVRRRSHMIHSTRQNDWAFDEPKNVATVTMRQIMREGHPILLVSHDADDGSWQFLTGGTFSTGDGLLVALHEIVKHDPTVSELSDLPLGWIAQRDAVGSPWRRSKDDHAGQQSAASNSG